MKMDFKMEQVLVHLGKGGSNKIHEFNSIKMYKGGGRGQVGVERKLKGWI